MTFPIGLALEFHIEYYRFRCGGASHLELGFRVTHGVWEIFDNQWFNKCVQLTYGQTEYFDKYEVIDQQTFCSYEFHLYKYIFSSWLLSEINEFQSLGLIMLLIIENCGLHRLLSYVGLAGLYNLLSVNL